MVGKAFRKLLRHVCLRPKSGFCLGPVTEPHGANWDHNLKPKIARSQGSQPTRACVLLVIIVDIKTTTLDKNMIANFVHAPSLQPIQSFSSHFLLEPLLVVG